MAAELGALEAATTRAVAAQRLVTETGSVAEAARAAADAAAAAAEAAAVMWRAARSSRESAATAQAAQEEEARRSSGGVRASAIQVEMMCHIRIGCL